MATPIPENHARFTLAEVVLATGGTVRSQPLSGGTMRRPPDGERRPTDRPGPIDVEAVGVTTDSRAVRPGTLFVALRGETHDGHAFASKASMGGASIVVVERGRAVNGPARVVEVADTLVAWGDLAGFHLRRWKQPENRVIAITGSAGKTTTKEITAALFGEAAFATPGNLNNRIGVPSVIFCLDESHRVAVLEMGMSLPGELDAITSFAPPDIAIVTNVGVAHAEGVGGREGVMHEKGAVYRALGTGGVAIVNADDPFVIRAAATTKGRIVTFTNGGDGAHAYRLVARVAEGLGSRVRVATPDRELSLFLPLPGDVAAIDLVAALAAREADGERLDEAALDAALANVRLAGRASLTHLPQDVLLLDDTYNANPASMRAAIATLLELAAGSAARRRTVAVLGEMKELGALAETEHAALDLAGLDLVIGCGGLVDLALAKAEASGIAVIYGKSTQDAAEHAVREARPGDAILVKGSRSVQAEKVVEALAKSLKSLPSPQKSAGSGAG